MNRTRSLIWTLVVALVGSNAWWVYRSFDAGVTETYRQVSLEEHHEALAQALAILPVAAGAGSTREEILGAAAASASHPDVFDKDGFTWVGQLGLRFSETGRLVAVTTSWEPF